METAAEAVSGANAVLVNVVIAFPNATGGGTTSAGTVQVNDLDGSAIGRAVYLKLHATDTQYRPLAGAANCTLDTATTGSIVVGAASDGLVILTDATGAFACTATNAADETVYFHAVTADKNTAETYSPQTNASYVQVVGDGGGDSATWSA
jgi:hypothetical protein